MYPVEVAYLEEPTTDYIKTAVEVTWKINLQVRLAVPERTFQLKCFESM